MLQEHEHIQVVRHATDAIAALAVGSSIAGLLPPIAAFLGICWYLMQMWDWLQRKRNTRRQRRRKSDGTHG